MEVQTGHAGWPARTGDGDYRGQLPAAVSLALALVLGGCAAHRVHAPPAVGGPRDSSYIDLQAGWRLRVVTPILRSGGYQLRPVAAESHGATVELAAGPDFLGYELAYYAAKPHGRVEFLSADLTRDGVTLSQPHPVVKLFALPATVKKVRLIYLVRASQADHMAVVAATDLGALEGLTRQVLANPENACRPDRSAKCAWIPAGIAVVPEIRRKVGGTEEWAPAR